MIQFDSNLQNVEIFAIGILVSPPVNLTAIVQVHYC
jgi:hypothetical protein